MDPIIDDILKKQFPQAPQATEEDIKRLIEAADKLLLDAVFQEEFQKELAREKQFDAHQNSVELIGHYGSDTIIACEAWTSTNYELTEEKIARIPKFVTDLWWDGHEVPFEKGFLRFRVNSDIATHIHLLKHRIASMGGESARYKELKEDKFYIPDDWNDKWIKLLIEHTNTSNKLYHECLNELAQTIGRKRAKESARFFKTYNSQITSTFAINLRSFANFLKLRNSEHAQKEVRLIAERMEELVLQIPGNPFEHSIKAIKDKNKKLKEIKRP